MIYMKFIMTEDADQNDATIIYMKFNMLEGAGQNEATKIDQRVRKGSSNPHPAPLANFTRKPEKD